MLINCVAYRDGRRLADIQPEEISDYVKLPDCFVWVALRDASTEEVLAMKEEFDLHELAVEDALHGQQRPKVEEYGDTLFAVMQTVQFTPTDELCTGEVSIFAGSNFVLSIRNRVAQSLLGVRARAEKEPHMLKRGPGFVMYAIMDAVVDRYFPVIEALEAELDAIEAQIFEPGVTRENIRRVYELKQRITTVKHAVSPLLDAVGKLVRGRVPPICEDTREYFRDVYDHLERMQSALDSLRTTDEPSCPKCGGRVWDNRLTKRNPKAPDFKCRDRSCDGVIWPAKGDKTEPRPGEPEKQVEATEEIPF